MRLSKTVLIFSNEIQLDSHNYIDFFCFMYS